VPNTDWLEVYYDGQDYTSMPETVADKSENEVAGTPSGGVGFDTEYKAFTFDGVDDYISGTLSNPSGAWVHSVSLWYRQDSAVTETLDYVYHIGAAASGEASIFAFKYDGYLVMSNYATASVRGRFVPTLGKWYHITVVYSGGGVNIDNVSIYLDGTIFPGLFNDGTSSSSVDLSANANFRIGARINNGDYAHGSIANFRIFNRALTGDEVWQLYAYQKEYFGHGNLDMALKSGRLGIGTTEPRAVLDVNGTLRAHGSVVQVVTNPVVGQYNYSANAAEVEIAALRTSFSPKFSDSLVLVQVYLSYEADYNAVIYIRANGNDIPTGQGRDYGEKEGVIPVAFDNNVSSTPNSSTFVVHHILNGEASVEYKVYYRTNSAAGTLYLNRAYTTVDEKGMSYVVITEIGQ